MPNSTIKPKPCPVCSSLFHSKMYHKPRTALKRTALPRATKRIKQQSTKEIAYQTYKETVLRPALIERQGNVCFCCHRPAEVNETLDIDHVIGKGPRPDLKRTLSNLVFLCRSCHRNKTDHIACLH